jgi:hypothetical protein
MLSSLLSSTTHDTIPLASNQPSDIDSLVEFYGHTAAKLHSYAGELLGVYEVLDAYLDLREAGAV